MRSYQKFPFANIGKIPQIIDEDILLYFCR